MSVDRYDLGGDCDGESGSCKAEMVKASNGDYVSFDDYAELYDELDALQKKVEAARKELE